MPTNGAVIVRCMNNLGDGAWSRPVIRALVERGEQIYVRTPFPAFYTDLPVMGFLKPRTELDVAKFGLRHWTAWADEPFERLPELYLTYSSTALALRNTILGALAARAKVERVPLDLPRAAPVLDEPYVVVVPYARRPSFPYEARGPLPKYLRAAFEAAPVATVALGGPNETREPAFAATYDWTDGRCSPTELIGLMRHAAGVVTGSCWAFPMAYAAGVPTLAVLGGTLWNHPRALTDPVTPSEHITFATPDPFCHCQKTCHRCRNKVVPDFDERLAQWLEQVRKRIDERSRIQASDQGDAHDWQHDDVDARGGALAA